MSKSPARERLSKNKLRCHQLLYQEAVLRIQIRDPVPFRSMDLGFQDPGSRIPNPQSFVAVVGSGIRDPRSEIRDPGWRKIRIRVPG
jgi:hypothetical protein